VTLHQGGGEYVITSCGQVLMATQETRSESALGHLAAQLVRRIRRPRVLVGGLGMGFTLRALLDGLPQDARVVVGELLRPVVRWNRERLGHVAGHPLDDPRVRLDVGDIANLIRGAPTWDAILLDVDNGPAWIVQRGNQALYGSRGIRRLLASLRPGGFFAVWSAVRHGPFERRLASAGLRGRRVLLSRANDGDPLIYVVRPPRGDLDERSGVASARYPDRVTGTVGFANPSWRHIHTRRRRL
jgi:spermidine synthase